MVKKQTNTSSKAFKGLMIGIIASTAVALATIIVLIALLLTIATFTTEIKYTGIAGTVFALRIVSYAVDITWIVCVAISLVKVDEVRKKINPNQYRIIFGIFLGLYLLFGMLGAFFLIPNYFHLALLVASLVFAIIHKCQLV